VIGRHEPAGYYGIGISGPRMGSGAGAAVNLRSRPGWVQGPWHNLRVSRISLLGFSTAGIETAIEVPSLGLVLDLGRCSRTAVNRPLVLVSHGHLDHVGPSFSTRRAGP
jgi:hypothetical protein